MKSIKGEVVAESRISLVNFTATPDNFGNISVNRTAQKFLLDAKENNTPDSELFEFIYSTQLTWGEEMRKKREIRRTFIKESNIKEAPSFLSTPEKEQNYYDKSASDIAKKAMIWLNKSLKKKK